MKPIDILLVEDNPADAELVREALRETRFAKPEGLHVVEDGVEAMQYLRREGAYAAVPRPDLVLLDLNLPRKDGREVLAELKREPTLRRIPVVVLSSSQAEQDIALSYDLYANCYVTKAVDLDSFIKSIASIVDYWFGTVRLPPK